MGTYKNPECRAETGLERHRGTQGRTCDAALQRRWLEILVWQSADVGWRCSRALRNLGVVIRYSLVPQV